MQTIVSLYQTCFNNKYFGFFYEKRSLDMKVEIFLGVLLAIIITCQSSTLIVNVVEILKIDNYTFVCNLSSSTNLTRWTYFAGSTGTSLMSYQNGYQCAVSGFLNDTYRYSYTCNNTTYQVTVKYYHLANRNNNILACKNAHQLNTTGSTWILKIKASGSCSYCQSTISFDVIKIAEGDNVTLVCSVPSNVSYVNWNRNIGANTAAMTFNTTSDQCTTQGTTFLDNTSKYIYICSNTVYQVTILNVQRSEHNDMYMCTPHNQTEGTGSNWIINVVKAQVTSVTITPSNYLVNVKENTAVEFTCTTSTARPTASVYWYRHLNEEGSHETQITSNVTTTTDYNDLSVTTSKLRLFVTRQDNNTKIFCRANNAVNQTLVRSKSKRILNVAYTSDDPYIVEGREYRVIENTPGTLSCTVRGGNPTPTLSWSCNKFSPTHQSTINSNGNVTSTVTLNVSRNHDGTCTCKSNQTGFTEKLVDVHLVVLYEAKIKSFTIDDFVDTSVTVNENGKVNFICTADSNPEAVMTLRHERKILNNVTSNNVEYNINKARCSDAGIYYCSATNKYIGEKISTQNIKLFVNCAPRAAAEVNTNITSAKNASKTITVNVIAYPHPTFTWSKLMNGTWTPLNTNDKFVISSSAVQSNLTIHRVGIDDFTKYRMIVKNEVGQMEQNLTLSPYGFPETPTELRHIQSQTTTSSIHIEWRPGYNGGPTQTFYIKYKKSSDSTWIYFTVIDNGEETMDLSLTGLEVDTQYDIVMFASNIIGNSTESQVLVASTEATSTSLGPLIGGIAGGVTVCIIIVIVIIVIIRRYKCSDDLVDNTMYTSTSPVARPASPSSDDKADLFKPNINGSNDLYGQVQKTKKKDAAVNGYETVDVNTDNNKKSNIKKPSQVKATTNESKMSYINPDGLNYADLVFNGGRPVEKKEMTVYEPTTYDLVDFTKKAEPLPNSDDDDKT